MNELLWWIVIPLTLAGILFVIYFNHFISYRNKIKNAWSDIDVQLKKRYSLIPNLVDTVKGYASHEKTLFENVAKYRSQAQQAGNVKEQEVAENHLIASLKQIFVLVENYPDLLATQNFSGLQNALIQVEDDLQNARRYYNAVVRDNNTSIERFPGMIFAGIFGFKTAAFFEIDNIERNVIEVKINS